MSLRDRIQDWLGISEVLMRQTTDRQLILDLSERLGSVQKQVIPLGPGIGRLIAKLDPHYATFDPFDPKTREESDKIANQALTNLDAEAAAREPHNHGQ